MKRRAFLAGSVSLCVCVLAAIACGKSSLKELTVDDVAKRLAANDGKTVAFDCNSRERFAKGHLPGAKWVQYDAVTAADLPQDKGVTLVFYCASEL
jgi:rhodanese-related sulfurtransferase